MSNRLPDRDRNEVLELLERRRRAFQRLPLHDQQTIDADRFVPMNELHDILGYFLITGTFADEQPIGRSAA
jgi:hypothetical protein